jgi:hypothetical protein
MARPASPQYNSFGGGGLVASSVVLAKQAIQQAGPSLTC